MRNILTYSSISFRIPTARVTPSKEKKGKRRSFPSTLFEPRRMTEADVKAPTQNGKDAEVDLEPWTINIRGDPGKLLSTEKWSFPTNFILIAETIPYFVYFPAVVNTNGNTNSISTTKYTLLTWLPKSIWEQFRRVANVYFLMISILMVCSSLAV